jgi:hypothetical protein
MRLITPLCMLIFTLLLAGCNPTAKNDAPPEKSTLNVIIDGATGKTAVDAKIRTEAKIRQISAAHNDDLNEALGE